MLTGGQLDRAAGVLLAQACGDALGVPHEFHPPMPPEERAEMTGSGVFGRGEWSDDSEMALCIGDAMLAQTPGSEAMLEQTAQLFLAWTAYARDIGIQIGEVLGEAFAASGSARVRCEWAARAFAACAGPHGGAGNGALMRTGVVGVACLADRDRTADLCRRVAGLTHVHDDVEDTCVLWTEAVRTAVVKEWQPGELLDVDHLLAGLDLIPAERRATWDGLVRESTGVEPRTIGKNGYTLKTLQAAWAAITWSQARIGSASDAGPERFLAAGLEAAVHAGWDTDTVAAVAGQLLGARWGASAAPTAWREAVRGRAPARDGRGSGDLRGAVEERRAADLVRLAREAAARGLVQREPGEKGAGLGTGTEEAAGD